MYTNGSATDVIQDGGTDSILYSPNGDTLESATATGKHYTNYAAEVKALSQVAQAILDIVGNHKEDVMFFTDSKSVLDAFACHGESHNDKIEMYCSLVDQFTSVFTIPDPQQIITDPVSFVAHESNTGINTSLF